MFTRLLAVISAVLALTAPAFAQFGEEKPTPKIAAEFFAERALSDAARLSEGTGWDVITDRDRVDLRRAQIRFDEARETYHSLCEDRTLPRDQWARNCYELGHIYRRGLGTAQDYAEAKRHYDAACLEGRHLAACMQQAYTSQKGSAGETDMEHARLLYSFACDLNEPGACAGLGNLMYRGLGGFQDRPGGMRLLQEACADDYEWACTRLGEYGLPLRVDRF